MEKNIISQPVVINNWIKTYLVGAMSQTQADDEGRGWRELLSKELNNRIDQKGNPLYIFNPCEQEQCKVGFSPKEFHKQIKQWIKEGKKEEVANGSRLIWFGKTHIEANKKGKFQLKTIPGDYAYVENSNFLICKIDKLDRPAGTYFEVGYSMKLGIPVYVLQSQPIEDYSESFVGWIFGSGGDFFKSQEELLTFLDEKYKLSTLETK